MYKQQKEPFHLKGNRKCMNNNANYLFPVNKNEIDRLQFQHYILSLVWENNFSAPVKELLSKPGTKVLDVGCGPAIWTLEVATEYPNASFTGIDIAPTYPIHTKPRNVEFLEANILHGLRYEDNTFDYVFCRFMNFSYTIKDWETVIKEITRVCKVGGYIEFMEKDIEFESEGEYTKKARLRFIKTLRKRKNIEPIITPKIYKYISETENFPEVNREKKKVPIGEWGGGIGKDYEYNFKWSADNLKNAMIEFGYNKKEWDLMVEKCIKELSDNRGCDNIHRIWAKKEEPQQMLQKVQKVEMVQKVQKVECKEVCKPRFNLSYKSYLSSLWKDFSSKLYNLI